MSEAASSPSGRYAVHPIAPAGPPREWEPAWRHRLVGALRSAHAARLRFAVGVGTASDARLVLEGHDVRSRAWIERTLLATYPIGSWHRSPPRCGPPEVVRWTGRRLGLPSAPPDPSWPVGGMLACLDDVLRSYPGPAELRICAAPAPCGRFESLAGWFDGPSPERRGPAQGLGPRLRGSYRPAPATGDGPPQRVPLWSAEFELGVGPAGDRGAAGRLGVAVAGVLGRLDRSRFVFRPAAARRLWAPTSWLREEELLLFLPGATAPTPSALSEGNARSCVPIGRTAEGALVGLPTEPLQGRHFVILGETGMGKSSLLASLAVRARDGAGVVLLDPLGETVDQVGSELDRAGRPYVRLGPGDPRVGMNLLDEVRELSAADPVGREQGIAAVAQTLRRVRAGRFSDAAYWGPRLEETLTRALRLAVELPAGTLADAYELLGRAGVERVVVPPESRSALRELAERVRARPEEVEGTRRLLYEVVSHPMLSRMLCCRAPTVRLSELLRPGRVVLLSGEAPRVGAPAARYLLSCWLALLGARLVERAPGAKTFLLLDEAQWFANEALAELLRLARRSNVHLGIASQSLASLPADVQEAVRTNVADLIVFRTGAEEARELGRALPAVTAGALAALRRGEAAVVLGKGERLAWVRTARLPPGAARAADAVAATEPRAVPEPGAPEPVPAREPPGVVRPTEPASVSDEVLASTLTGLVSASGTDDLVAVPLAALRERAPGDEAALRRLGGRLGRAGALVRSGTGAAGSVWWVSRRRLAALRRGRPLPSPPDSSSAQHL